MICLADDVTLSSSINHIQSMYREAVKWVIDLGINTMSLAESRMCSNPITQYLKSVPRAPEIFKNRLCP